MSEKSELRQAYEKMSASLYHTRGRLTAMTAERDKLREALEWANRELSNEGLQTNHRWFCMMRELGLLLEDDADEAYIKAWGGTTMYVLAWQAKGATDE